MATPKTRLELWLLQDAIGRDTKVGSTQRDTDDQKALRVAYYARSGMVVLWFFMNGTYKLETSTAHANSRAHKDGRKCMVIAEQHGWLRA